MIIKIHRSVLLSIVAALLVACGDSPAPDSATSSPARYDLVLQGGTLYSGADEPPFIGDIAINGDRIAAVGNLGEYQATQAIDVTGLAVMPGFIDIHSHALSDQPDQGIFGWPDAENLIRQGVTTVIEGNDGSSPVPLEPSFEAIAALPPAINFGSFIGHGSIRALVVGEDDRPPTEEELELMREQVALGMEQGAFGLSSGLIYAPGRFADTDEVVELARVAGQYNGMYISHMREEGLALLDSVAETILIGEEAGLPTQLTHHKVVGAPMWGASADSLRLVDEAIERGVDVSIDQYPYTASSTNLMILFPGWALDGGREALLARMADPSQRQRLRNDIIYNIEVDRGGDDPANVVLAGCPHDESLNGMNLSQVLLQQGQEVSKANAAELLMDLVAAGNCSAVFHAMVEEDVHNIMRHPRTMIASDGGVEGPSSRAVHPRNYGTFARLIGHYARDLEVIPVHTAIHKVTQMPAQRLNMTDRGILEPGAVADIAVLDIARVRELTTFADPHQYSEGAAHVLVAGELVLNDGAMTGARPGRIVRSSDYRSAAQ
ncbi:N-acyl-D-amino-acid deacylase family protein [Pseudohongiella sp. O18]|uniref:N-acyl-D-amino-acid deacylase family protein n=1 Tax=Pseudohongiella sp. O18 TaxID=2904248 RepID=UPI001F329C8B|nr:D-aminoacylase [Pseudohongiella sp. O18]